MATYNRAHLIPETLKAIENQTYTNFECLIIDDGSTDKTAGIINLLNLDTRFQYFIRPKEYTKGPSGCRNYGIDLATGNFVLFFDDDDIAHPDLLNIIVPVLSKNEVDFCRYLRTVFYKEEDIVFDRNVDFDSFEISKNDFDKIVSDKLPMNTCAVVWKRRALGTEKFNEELFYSDEWEYFQRLLLHDLKGISINKVLIYARKHPVSSTNKFLKKNKKYVNSTHRANALAIANIYARGKMTPLLFQYFVRRSIELKDEIILDHLLENSDKGFLIKWKYKLGFKIYPLLKPFFKAKKTIGKMIK